MSTAERTPTVTFDAGQKVRRTGDDVPGNAYFDGIQQGETYTVHSFNTANEDGEVTLEGVLWRELGDHGYRHFAASKFEAIR